MSAAPVKCRYAVSRREFVGHEENLAGLPVCGRRRQGGGVPAEIIEGLRANFTGECTEVGMYLARRVAFRELPRIGLYWEKAAYEEAEHASKFAEFAGEVVTTSTEENLKLRVEAEKAPPQQVRACQARQEAQH